MARSRRQKQQESSETVARRIWLAGLGAYGKSLEDAHDQLDKASQDASRFFHDLVDKGQSIEEQSRDAIRERISEARERITGARERISEVAGSNTRSVEDMISRVRQRLGFGDDPVQGRLDALARQVNSLARAVTGLARRADEGVEPDEEPPRRKPRGAAGEERSVKTTRKATKKPPGAKSGVAKSPGAAPKGKARSGGARRAPRGGAKR